MWFYSECLYALINLSNLYAFLFLQSAFEHCVCVVGGVNVCKDSDSVSGISD